MKLFKRRGHKCFYCRVPGPRGRLVTRPCFTRDRTMARKVAASWKCHYERERAKAESGAAGTIIHQLSFA